MQRIPVSIFLLLLLSHIKAQKLSYSDIVALGVSCSPHDTCSVPRNISGDNLLRQNCECHQHCSRLKTCCIDSPFLTRKVPNTSAEICAQVFNTNLNVFLVSRCKSTWRGSPIIRAFCEGNRYTFRDPLGVLPVTNPSTQVSYKNYFCAVCHDDDENVVSWSIDIEVFAEELNSTQTLDRNRVIDNLVYIAESNTWGLSTKNDGGEWDFTTVDLRFNIPDNLRSAVRFCRPDLVSSCAPTWRDVSTQRECENYMASIYVDLLDGDEFRSKVGFRNIHCALCNFVNVTDYDCRQVFEISSGAPRPPMSFALLLDLNQSDGELVGRVNSCGKNEVFDPFFKKCRSMMCALPGFVVRDGKCVRG